MSKLPGFKVVLGLEGLRNLENVSDIDKLYEMGFRHAMVTWNEENKYATGAKANPERGLTEEGKKLYKRMQELGMIIDLAHLNEKSFYEALEVVDKNIIYSHGCLKKFCGHVRNVTEDQMKALKKVDGLLGLTLANNFVNSDKEKQDLEHFLDHVDEAVKVMDVIVLLRVQNERHGEGDQVEKSSYLELYGMTKERALSMKEGAIIMHPAPFNRGIEIEDAVLDLPQCRIFKQMKNGVFVRQAVLKRSFE